MTKKELIENSIKRINYGKEYSENLDLFNNEFCINTMNNDDFFLVLKKIFSYCDSDMKNILSFFYSCTSYLSGVLETETGKLNFGILMHILNLCPEKEYLKFLDIYFGDEGEDDEYLRYAKYEQAYFSTQIQLIGSLKLGGGLKTDVIPPVFYLLSLIDIYNVRIYNKVDLFALC